MMMMMMMDTKGGAKFLHIKHLFPYSPHLQSTACSAMYVVASWVWPNI